MGRPRAVSADDMRRTLDTLARCGVIVQEVIIEPGRVRIIPAGMDATANPDDAVKPLDWPSN